MSFRLSEIRKTKRASHWSKRGPYHSAPANQNAPSLSLPSLLHDSAFMLPQMGNENLSRTGSGENPVSFPMTLPSSISPTDSK